jgi:membrane protein
MGKNSADQDTKNSPHLLKNLWGKQDLRERGWRGRIKAVCRVFITSWRGIAENRLPQQSAALTYYTLMSIGPILALALTISGYILTQSSNTEDNLAKKSVVASIQWIAPQINASNIKIISEKNSAGPEQTQKLHDISENLDKMVDQLLANAASGEAGLIGLFFILGLAVLMLSRVEDALNGIWGVRVGRHWYKRCVNYLLFLILFFLVGATSITMLSAASIAHAIGQSTSWLGDFLIRLPLGEEIIEFISGNGPFIISFLLLWGAFILFNHIMPNGRVYWSAAAIGGLAVTVLIILNHQLSALYVSKVTQLQSLYGGVSILVIIMFGTYLSWFFVLLGGQIAFAYQHRRSQTQNKNWEHLSHQSRRALAFTCCLESLRRYEAGEAGVLMEDLVSKTNLPSGIIESCLLICREKNLLVGEFKKHGMRPAKMLEKMTVGQLWKIVDGDTSSEVNQFNDYEDSALRELIRIEESILEAAETRLTLGQLAAHR